MQLLVDEVILYYILLDENNINIGDLYSNK